MVGRARQGILLPEGNARKPLFQQNAANSVHSPTLCPQANPNQPGWTNGTRLAYSVDTGDLETESATGIVRAIQIVTHRENDVQQLTE